jgi:hypothetical protein
VALRHVEAPHHLNDHPPAVGIGLELAHLVAGDGDVEQGIEAKARQGVQGNLARVVGPQGRVETDGASPPHGLHGAGFERGLADRLPLVVERDRPEIGLQGGSLGLAEGDQLANPVPLGTGRKGTPPVLQVATHVERHRAQVEGRADERVVEVEDTEPHVSTVA